MKAFWIYLVVLYQRHISPRKGYRCAHAFLHGGDSCSNAVIKILNDKGLIRGFPLIIKRFKACREASAILGNKNKRTKDKYDDGDECSLCHNCFSSVSRCEGSESETSGGSCEDPFDCSP